MIWSTKKLGEVVNLYTMDYLKYYYLEDYLFGEVKNNFM